MERRTEAEIGKYICLSMLQQHSKHDHPKHSSYPYSRGRFETCFVDDMYALKHSHPAYMKLTGFEMHFCCVKYSMIALGKIKLVWLHRKEELCT